MNYNTLTFDELIGEANRLVHEKKRLLREEKTTGGVFQSRESKTIDECLDAMEVALSERHAIYKAQRDRLVQQSN